MTRELTVAPSVYPYPTAHLGIIGGGQLARMMVVAAQRLGCHTTVLDARPQSPAGQLATHERVGGFHDPAALTDLVRRVTHTTFDLEDIDAQTLIELSAQGHIVLPDPGLLAVVQDKFVQKSRLRQAGIPTAEYVDAPAPDAAAFRHFGYPLVQKLRRGGYDGRGVVVMAGPQDAVRRLDAPSLIERFIPAQMEIAVMAARGADGRIAVYPVVEMVFDAERNVLDKLLAPARITASTRAAAQALAARAVTALGGVGVFGVEMFLTGDGALLVNEISPRTHNSGHYTLEACVTDQFEQHLRAVLGLPLGSTQLLQSAVMLNLLGEPGFGGAPVVEGLAEVLTLPGVAVHLYGKDATRAHRKMGHVTVLDDTVDGALAKAEQVRQTIRVIGDRLL